MINSTFINTIIKSAAFLLMLLLPVLSVQAQSDGDWFEGSETGYFEDYGDIRYVPNRVLIKMKPGADKATVEGLKQSIAAEHEFTLDLIDAQAWRFSDKAGLTMEQVLADLNSNPDVEYAQPDIIYDEPDVENHGPAGGMDDAGMQGVTPNDEFFELMWGLRNTGQAPFNGTPGADISATDAWALETGDPDVIIAVLDSGIQYDHPDLADNMWQSEDGFFGANFAGGNTNDPMDFGGHGTHVAGTVAAVGNNDIGVTGVMWEAKLMAIRVCNNGCSLSAIVNGLNFAIENGAQISNNSYGSQEPTSAGPPPAYINMMQAAKDAGHFFITSAGNSNNDNDVLNVYPANLMRDFDNVFSVGNSTPNDTRNPGSCFGAETVHLFAPGTQTASTYINGGYEYLSGTSMASPHVAGVAGLILSANPDADYQFIKDRLMEGVDELPAFENISISGGRLNAANSVLVDDGNPPANVTDLAVSDIAQNLALLSWTAPGNSGMEGRAGDYELRFSTEPITEENFEDAPPLDLLPSPSVAGSNETFVVRGLEPGTTYYFGLRATDVFGNESGISNIVAGTTDEPAGAALDITDITETITVEESETYTFSMSNTGSGDLRFVVPSAMAETAARMAGGHPVHAGMESYRISTGADAEPKGMPVTKGAGGPDEGGYFWIDDAEFQGLSFVWDDITEEGTEVVFENEVNGITELDLPFDFPFYGEMQQDFVLGVNGLLSFNILPVTGVPGNVPLPASSSAVRNIVAPFWTDLDISEGSVHTLYDEAAETFTIQWTDARRNLEEDAGSYTFQVVFNAAGNISFRYLDMQGSISHATVGVQPNSGDDALLIAYNTNFTKPLKAVNVSPGLPEWLSISPSSGIIGPGESLELVATVDGTDFVNGDYTTGLMFLNNDLENAFLNVPVNIEAEGGMPDILLSDSSIDFGTVFLDYPETREMYIINEGRADLSFEGIEAANPGISVDFADDAEGVAALDSVMVSITYDPAEVELLDEELTISTNDAATGDIAIELIGEAVIAPDMRLNRNLLFAEVEPGQIQARQMTVRNAGGSTLNYSVDFEETTEGNEGNFPSWILYVDGDGSLEPEEIDELTVRFRGSVEPGEYTADMIITSNDPSRAESRVTLQLTVATSTSTDPQDALPTSFELSQNYPNPFNPTTQISYAVPENTHVRLEVFNVQGQRVAVLVDEQRAPGQYSATFDAANLSSGVYIYQLQASGFTKTQKMLLVK